MWTSLARVSMASSRISFTSRTTEASWAISDSSEPSVSISSSSSTSSSSCWAIRPSIVSLPTPRCVLMSLAISVAAGQHRHRSVRPVDGAELVERVEIERIAGGDDEGAVFSPHRKQRLPVDQLWRKIFQQRQIEIRFRQVDVVQANFRGQGFQHGLFRAVAHLHGNLLQARAIALGGALRPIDAR